MIDLTAEQWIIVFIGLITIVPSTVLTKQYLKTRVLDFLLFAGMFISAFLAASSHIVAGATDMLIYYQIVQWSLSITSFLFFLHSVRLVWVRTPTVIWYVGVIWFALLMFLILLWEKMEQTETAYVLFMEMPRTYSDYYPKGAGLVTDGGVTVLSTSHYTLATLYRLFGAVLLLYAYSSVRPISPSERIKLSRRLWIANSVILLVWTIYLLPGVPHIPYMNGLILVILIIVAYIAIFIPETMLISHVQLLRALELYKKVQQVDTRREIEAFGTESIVRYLERIPANLLASPK